jgi:hypothetical protein
VLLHNASAEQVFAEPFELFDIEQFARPSWHHDAACREFPSLSWFVEPDDDIEEQRWICSICSVAVECAMAGASEVGIWAGVNRAPVVLVVDARQRREEVVAWRIRNPDMPRTEIAEAFGITEREVRGLLRQPRRRTIA